MVTLKPIINLFEQQKGSIPKDKDKTKYIIDKSFIEAWIEKNDDDSKHAKVFSDLIAFIKRKKLPLDVFIPIDCLLALKKDNKKYVENEDFKRIISSLFTIIEVDPEDSDLKQEESIKILTKAYVTQGYNIVIITLNEKLYEDIKKVSNVYIKKPDEMLFIIACFCSMFPELTQVYETWFNSC